jgi:tetratricopeptide (TPR) repeat protein
MIDVTLHIIAKNEVDKVKWIIGKYKDFFTYIDVAVDELVDEFKKLEDDKVAIYPYEWSKEEKDFGGIFFDRKRNFLANKCRTEFYFRLDTDDEIVNPEAIQGALDRAVKEDITVITTYYDYSRDEWGNTNAAHYRETIIKNAPFLFWNKHIHENIIPKDTFNFFIVRDDSLHILHVTHKDHAKESVIRNAKYLVDEYNRDKDKTDLRTIAYLGRTFMGLGDNKRAIFFLEKHIQGSGWSQDRYLSWCQMAHIYRVMEDYQQSLACAFEALQEIPDYPDAYFEIHDAYFQQEKWEKAIHWATMGFTKPIPKTNMLIDPSNYTWRPMLSLAGCYYQTGDFERAWEVFQKVEKLVPTLEYIKSQRKVFEDAFYHDKYVKHFTWLLAYTKDKNFEGVADLVKSVPKELYQHDAIAKARNLFLPRKVWSDKSVVIFCGTTWEAWTPKSIESGIGGSEEAVIQLSKSLVELGYEVTVYNDCGDDAGVYDGVEYKNFIFFNPKDAFNILVSWRSNVFNYGIEARNKIIWVHDLPINLGLTKEGINAFDKIVVLSQYHATLLPDYIPKEKIFVSTNGIVPEDFVGIESKRNPRRVIYASSYNRGLETILDAWKSIKEAVPDAELHIYYGWNTYDRAVATGDVQDKGWKAVMLKKMAQEGVYEHGRVGHKELLKEYAKAGVWAYPCEYSGEINCIALTKAIGAGCIPVTNNAYVMKERNPQAVTDDKFVSTLIDVLKNGSDIPFDRTAYIADNSWTTVAQNWHTELFPITIPTIVENRLKWIRNCVHKKEKAVEIGCANGFIFKEYPNMTRVDIDNWHNLENFVQANAEELPFKDKEFDVAILGEVLEHVKNPNKALSEALRVANRVVITVPLEQEWHHPQAVPFDTLEREEAETRKKREDIYKDTKDVTFFKGDNYEHLRHCRWYDYETFKQELSKVSDNYSVVRLRDSGLIHLGGVIS